MPLSKLFHRRSSKDKQSESQLKVEPGKNAKCDQNISSSQITEISSEMDSNEEVPLEKGIKNVRLEESVVAERKPAQNLESLVKDEKEIVSDEMSNSTMQNQEISLEIKPKNTILSEENDSSLKSLPDIGITELSLKEQNFVSNHNLLDKKNGIIINSGQTIPSSEIILEGAAKTTHSDAGESQTQVKPEIAFEELVSDQINNQINSLENENVCEDGNNSLKPIVSNDEEAGKKYINVSKTYMRSISDSAVHNDVKKKRRRKCASENRDTKSYVSTEATFLQQFINEGGTSLDEAISRCVDKMIRESIITAIKSVNVESLYEEISKDFNDCRTSVKVNDDEYNSDEYATSECDQIEDAVEDGSTEECSGGTACERNLEAADECVMPNTDKEICLVEESNGAAVNDYQGEARKMNDATVGVQIKMMVDSQSCMESCKTMEVDSIKATTPCEYREIGDDSGKGKVNCEVIDDNFTDNVCPVECEVICEEYCELEEAKYANIDGYQADTEESSSIYSFASASSVEVLGKSKNQTETDDCEVSVENAGENMKNEDDVASDIAESIIKDSLNSMTHASGSLSVKVDEQKPVSDIAAENFKNDLLTCSEADEVNSSKSIESKSTCSDIESNSKQDVSQMKQDEEKKINWKVGYLHVKLPHKSRGKGHLKVWKKRYVSIQPDEFVNDPKNPCLIISVYSAESGTSRKHTASFWKAVSCQKAVVYRSSSRSHRYAFTISDDDTAVIHLSADSEVLSQEWMTAIRAILWPPSPVIQLEKMLYGNEFEISLIDNDFSYHAGLLGMYGYLSITPKKLILLHPQQGYVIQEWYLNTVDKFQLMPQSKVEDVNKVLSMTTCSDSSTGRGEILIFCNDAVSLLQSLAKTIHQVLSHHSKHEGGKYKKELDEMADWLIGPTTTKKEVPDEDLYKVPPRQVKSLLDIPNFIFEKSLSPVASMTNTTAAAEVKSNLETLNANISTDSGISAGHPMDDLLNCSVASFVLGGGTNTGKSSDSELSDSYTPPCSPKLPKKHSMVLECEEFTEESQT